MKEIISLSSVWFFILIAIVWRARQICASMKLFGFKFDRRFVTVQIALMVTAVLIWAIGAWFTISLAIDRCLDSSGRWNSEKLIGQNNLQ